MLLKAFNPHELPSETVFKIATGRDEERQHVISTIRQNLGAETLQHLVISAPRGYGKSFFLRLIELTVKQLVAKEGLPLEIVLLPEELPHVKEPETLISEIRRSLVGEPSSSLVGRWEEDDGSAWEDAIEALDAAIDARFGAGRGLVVASVENFDVLLQRAFSKPVQASRLRALLTRRGGRLMLLAASARGNFDRDYDRPLFKAFEEVRLSAWTVDQCLAFFGAHRATAGKPPLTDSQRARAKAVATYIGGTPRLATLIGEAILDDDTGRAADLLDRLVDELTPYYKDRVDALPKRSQLLLDTLLRGGEPCSATELAQRVSAGGQHLIAAPLNELRMEQIVTGVKAPASAEVLYRVSDRVFAHYYQKRVLRHGQDICPLEALVDLLEEIYSPAEKKEQADRFAALGRTRESELMTRLWIADQKRAQPRDVKRTAELVERAKKLFREKQPHEATALLQSEATAAHQSARWYDEYILRGEIVEYYLTTGLEKIPNLAVSESNLSISLAADHLSKRELVIALVGGATIHSIREEGELAEALARRAMTAADELADTNYQALAAATLSGCLYQNDKYEEALAFIHVVRKRFSRKALGSLDLPLETRVAECLLMLNRPKEALKIATSVEAKAGRKQLPAKIDAILVSAASFSLLDRYSEVAKYAQEAARLAAEVANQEALGRALFLAAHATKAGDNSDSAIEVLGIVLAAMDRKFTPVMERAIILILSMATERRLLKPVLEILFGYFRRIPRSAGNDTHVLYAPAAIIKRTLQKDLAEGRSQIKDAILSAVQAAHSFGSDKPFGRGVRMAINGIALVVAQSVAEPEALEEVAQLISTQTFTTDQVASDLVSLAAYHRSNRDEAFLARISPDLATMIRETFKPNSNSTSPKRRRRNSRNSG